jgi:hypothetical protein
LSNLQAAGQAEKELGAQIVVIKKTSEEYRREKDPLPCPSVVVNGTLIARNDTVTYETLKSAIMNENDRQGRK